MGEGCSWVERVEAGVGEGGGVGGREVGGKGRFPTGSAGCS